MKITKNVVHRKNKKRIGTYVNRGKFRGTYVDFIVKYPHCLSMNTPSVFCINCGCIPVDLSSLYSNCVKHPNYKEKD